MNNRKRIGGKSNNDNDDLEYDTTQVSSTSTVGSSWNLGVTEVYFYPKWERLCKKCTHMKVKGLFTVRAFFLVEMRMCFLYCFLSVLFFCFFCAPVGQT